MFLALFLVFFVCWIFGFVVFHVAGGLIHALLIVAAIRWRGTLSEAARRRNRWTKLPGRIQRLRHLLSDPFGKTNLRCPSAQGGIRAV